MAGPLIRMGDKTSHGGTVLEASQHSDSGGIGIARLDDGDKTACGAVLIAGQHGTIDPL